MSQEALGAVPASLVLKGAQASGEAGLKWRQALPDTVASLVREWSLTVDAPFPDLSFNYAAPALRDDGSAAVLKVWFPDDHEFRAEAEALRLYDGDGSIRLLEIDIERRAMLLERAEPGSDLWQLEDEDRQIEITAAIMRRLWRPPPQDCVLPVAAVEFERMAALAPQRAPANFPLHWVPSAKAIFDDLEAAATPVVLHEDLHQANILAAQREPWLAIDPHGRVGPPVLDVIQMILNVVWAQQDSVSRRRTIARYADKFGGALGLDREAIRLCGLARAVMESFWTLEDSGKGWERDVALVEDFAAAR